MAVDVVVGAARDVSENVRESTDLNLDLLEANIRAAEAMGVEFSAGEFDSENDDAGADDLVPFVDYGDHDGHDDPVVFEPVADDVLPSDAGGTIGEPQATIAPAASVEILPNLDHGEPVTDPVPVATPGPVQETPIELKPITCTANISVDSMRGISDLNARLERVGIPTIRDDSESPEITAQRLRVSDLVLEETMLKARMKNLKKELEVEAELLQEMISAGPRSITPVAVPVVDGLSRGAAVGGVTITVEAGSSAGSSSISNQNSASSPRRGMPPDPAGEVAIESVLKISKGVLEKLNGLDVKTVRDLERFMQEGKFVPGRTKGIGETAIEKITDSYVEYRAKHPVPNWEDWEAEQAEKERAANPGMTIEIPANTMVVLGADMKIEPGIVPESPSEAIDSKPETIAAESEAIAPESESPAEEPQFIVPIAMVEFVMNKDREPEPLTAEELDEVAAQQVALVSALATAPAPAAKKSVRAVYLKDGSVADMPAYRAGESAAASEQSVASNPHKPGSHLWQSWDAGWQAYVPF
ncbi:MAG: hypothetical protein NT069_31355 [Planctomycetota bacterium]|nr:hypothetical protein [Planctomycetota bacterium]